MLSSQSPSQLQRKWKGLQKNTGMFSMLSHACPLRARSHVAHVIGIISIGSLIRSLSFQSKCTLKRIHVHVTLSGQCDPQLQIPEECTGYAYEWCGPKHIAVSLCICFRPAEYPLLSLHSRCTVYWGFKGRYYTGSLPSRLPVSYFSLHYLGRKQENWAKFLENSCNSTGNVTPDF